MEKKLVNTLLENFGKYSFEEDGVQFWFARDLQELLGYTKWENFIKIIKKAKESCKNANFDDLDHFLDARKKVSLGSKAQRQIDDMILTRYACYLIAQNGDPRKEEVAFAQSYFAVQTRKQELIEERIKLKERFDAREKLSKSETELSKNIYERGVNERGFARIRSKGDFVLFGGNNTQEMKKKLKIPKSRPIADFLPTVTIAAKNFATEMTNFTVQHGDLQGETNITNEHMKNNGDVRQVMLKNKIIPEELPAEEDIKKLDRKIKRNENLLAAESRKN